MALLQIIVFDVGGVACALRRSTVREFLPLPRLWRPPGLPRPVAGFFNLGGRAVPVLCLGMLFGLDRGQAEAGLYRHLILIDGLGRAGPGALLVDRVQDVATVADTQFSPMPESGTLNGCVEAEIDVAGRLVHLLSLERVLLAEEQQALAALGRDAQNRLREWAASA